MQTQTQDDMDEGMVARRNPVGVFDSGVGGLSVLRALRDALPYEHFLYVADSACAPYGERSPAFVIERAVTITDFLVHQGAKAVVVACNTATAVAVESLRARFAIPIVAIEPAVKPAAARTRSRVVGVLATTGTLASPNMSKLLATYGSDVEFVIQPCPGLADLVEKAELASNETRALVKRYVQPIADKHADILVLGCTHYPFLRPLIEEVAGPGVEIIDPATAVARELGRRLEIASLLADRHVAGTEQFWTTGKAESVEPIVRKLWGHDATVAGLSAPAKSAG
jgi:glutamate racemase